MDVQINCHVYFPANGGAKINCTWLSGCVCVGRTFLPLHVIPSRAHRASQCLKGLRAVPLCVSVGWTCQSTAHPPLHAVCLPASRLHVPSAHSRAALAPPANKGAAGGFVLSCQSRAGPTEGPAQRALLPPGCWTQLTNQQLPLLTISRSPLQVCNLRKTNKCSAEWLYLSEI